MLDYSAHSAFNGCYIPSVDFYAVALLLSFGALPEPSPPQPTRHPVSLTWILSHSPMLSVQRHLCLVCSRLLLLLCRDVGFSCVPFYSPHTIRDRSRAMHTVVCCRCTLDTVFWHGECSAHIKCACRYGGEKVLYGEQKKTPFHGHKSI